MGKHERDWVEIAEKAVTDSLNGVQTNNYIQKVSASIVEELERLYNASVVSSSWIGGGSYEDKGDVSVLLSNGVKVPVELKFSKASSSGTKGNISTNVLKKYVGDVQSYPKFDEQGGYLSNRYRFVESQLGRGLKNASDYCKVLRQYRKSDKSVLETVANITEPGQLAYAKYAAEAMNKNLNGVTAMVNNILDGNNTMKADTLSKDLVYCVVKKFGGKGQTVEFYDFTDMDAEPAAVVASGKSIKIQNAAGKDILRFSVTWKNICQGGSTPCFNVFVGNAYN